MNQTSSCLPALQEQPASPHRKLPLSHQVAFALVFSKARGIAVFAFLSSLQALTTLVMGRSCVGRIVFS